MKKQYNYKQNLRHYTNTKPNEPIPDQIKLKDAKYNESISNHCRPDQNKPKRTKPDKSKSNQTRPDQTKSNQTRPDQHWSIFTSIQIKAMKVFPF